SPATRTSGIATLTALGGKIWRCRQASGGTHHGCRGPADLVASGDETSAARSLARYGSGAKWRESFRRSSYRERHRDLAEATMTHLRALVVLCGAAVVVTACASQTQTLANKQGAAMEAALQRGR